MDNVDLTSIFDFDTPLERAGTWSTRWDRYAGRDVIPLWVADSDFRTAPAVLEALQRKLEHGVFGYTSAPGELRDAIVARLDGLYRWRIDPGWIVFIPGVVAGLHLAARRLLQPGEHGLLPRPVYHHLKRCLELAPRPFTEVPLVLERGRWVPDLDYLGTALKQNSRAYFLCNPQNPGGTVYSREELGRLAQATRDLLIVSDEIHCDLVLEPHLRHTPIASLGPEVSRRTITLMSPNKTFNFPAAGCAWAIIENAALRKAFAAEIDAHVLPSASVFGYVAALAALRDGGPWLAAQLDYLRANRDLVESSMGLQTAPLHMAPLHMAHVEATYLAWIDASGLGVKDPHAHFLEHGVALSPGAQFGAPGFVRLNFGTQRSRLQEALKRISASLTTSSRQSPRG